MNNEYDEHDEPEPDSFEEWVADLVMMVEDAKQRFPRKDVIQALQDAIMDIFND